MAKYTKVFAFAATAGVATAAYFMGTDAAFAKTFGDVATNLGSAATTAKSAVESFAYLGGAGVGLMSLFKFKQHSENPQQVKLSEPIVMALVSGGLLALPTYMSTGKDTMFGSGSGPTNMSSVTP